MGKGLGIAGIIIAVMSIFAWYGLNFLAVWTACLCAFFAALSGEKGYAVATSVIGFASLAFFSPITAAVMIQGLYGANPGGATLALVTGIALAAPIIAGLIGGGRTAPPPAPFQSIPPAQPAVFQAPAPADAQSAGAGAGGAVAGVLIVVLILGVSAYWYYATKMKPTALNQPAGQSTGTTGFFAQSDADISSDLVAVLSKDGAAFPGSFGTQAFVFKPDENALTISFYAFDRRSGKVLAIVKTNTVGDRTLLFGEASGTTLKLTGTNGKVVWTLAPAGNGRLTGSYAPDQFSVVTMSIDVSNLGSSGPSSRTFTLSDTQRQAADGILAAQLEFLLGAADEEAKELAAEQMWLKFHDDRAKPAYRQLLLANLSLARDDASAIALAQNLAGIGYDEAKEPLLAFVKRAVDEGASAPGAVAATNILATHNDAAAAAYARGTLRDKADKLRILLRPGYAETDHFVCERLGGSLASLLAATRGSEDVAVLRYVFSRTASSVESLSITAFASGVGGEQCQKFYMSLLAQADSPLWNDVKLDYPGWSIFHRMIPGRIDDLRSNASMPSFDGNKWPLVQPGNDAAAAQLVALAQRLGSHDPFNGAARDVNIGTNLIEFSSPTQARVTFDVCQNTCETSNGGRKLGEFTITFDASGPNPMQPWMITSIDAVSLEG